MVQKVLENTLTPEDTYEVLDVMLSDILNKSGACVGDEELRLLISYNRVLRIGLGLPVEVAS